MNVNRIFDDVLDELEITYDVYYRMDFEKPRCVFILNWLLGQGIKKCNAFIVGLYPDPLSMLFRKSGFMVKEIEVKKKVEKWERDKDQIILNDIWKIETLSENYDLVICDDLLQYFTNSDYIIQVLMGKLKKDGILIMTCPNVVSAASRLRLLAGRNIFPEPEDVHLPRECHEEENCWQVIPYREYTLPEVMDLLASSGARVIDGQYIIGKKTMKGGFHPPSLRPYFFRKMCSVIQKAIPQTRSYLFVAAKQANE